MARVLRSTGARRALVLTLILGVGFGVLIGLQMGWPWGLEFFLYSMVIWVAARYRRARQARVNEEALGSIDPATDSGYAVQAVPRTLHR